MQFGPENEAMLSIHLCHCLFDAGHLINAKGTDTMNARVSLFPKLGAYLETQPTSSK